jgi:hypothetical protein
MHVVDVYDHKSGDCILFYFVSVCVSRYVIQCFNFLRLHASSLPPDAFVRSFLQNHATWRAFEPTLLQVTSQLVIKGLGLSVPANPATKLQHQQSHQHSHSQKDRSSPSSITMSYESLFPNSNDAHDEPSSSSSSSSCAGHRRALIDLGSAFARQLGFWDDVAWPIEPSSSSSSNLTVFRPSSRSSPSDDDDNDDDTESRESKPKKKKKKKKKKKMEDFDQDLPPSTSTESVFEAMNIMKSSAGQKEEIQDKHHNDDHDGNESSVIEAAMEETADDAALEEEGQEEKATTFKKLKKKKRKQLSKK